MYYLACPVPISFSGTGESFPECSAGWLVQQSASWPVLPIADFHDLAYAITGLFLVAFLLNFVWRFIINR